ncbi:MAG TPA: hypothetical protein VHD62_13945 [Opitutaceae bacterium]|nr:hypothetical protein [Opitutaceae bacterium]
MPREIRNGLLRDDAHLSSGVIIGFTLLLLFAVGVILIVRGLI